MSFYDDGNGSCAEGCEVCAMHRELWRSTYRRRTLRTLVTVVGVVAAVTIAFVLLACGGGIQPASEGDRPLQTGRQPTPASAEGREGRGGDR